MLKKLFISDKCWSSYSSKIEKMYSTVLNIDNQHITMISEGSCDTEDWSNAAENIALITGINYILIYIQIESSYFK